MKSMQVTYHRGNNAPRHGYRIVPVHSSEEQKLYRVDDYFRKGSSAKIGRFFSDPRHLERKKWAQLSIFVDDIELVFWLPEELDHVCDVFQMMPFPTALHLTNKDEDEANLNRHWLSRLPKKAKAKKFRDKFIKFVRSEPKELLEFRSFYSS